HALVRRGREEEGRVGLAAAARCQRPGGKELARTGVRRTVVSRHGGLADARVKEGSAFRHVGWIGGRHEVGDGVILVLPKKIVLFNEGQEGNENARVIPATALVARDLAA